MRNEDVTILQHFPQVDRSGQNIFPRSKLTNLGLLNDKQAKDILEWRHKAIHCKRTEARLTDENNTRVFLEDTKNLRKY